MDEETLDYLLLTGRSKDHIDKVRAYLKANSMFYEKGLAEPIYTEIIELDLSTVETGLSGPKRPQDLISLGQMKEAFVSSVTAPLGNQGHGLTEEEFEKKVNITLEDGRKGTITTGSVVIASITSCTNTSNPSVMLGAGLLAKKAVEKGLKVPPYVKTSLAPALKWLQDILNQQTFKIPRCTRLSNSRLWMCHALVPGPLLPEITCN